MKLAGMWLGAGLFALASLASLAAPVEPLHLNSGVGPPYFKDDGKGFLELIIPEIFGRIGVKADAVRYAATERAMINANNGIDDGTALRVRGIEKGYPNLVRVEEKIIDNDFVAYASEANFATTGFDSLKPYQVGYINGWKIFEANVTADTAVTRVQDAEQLFTLLANKRADVVLFERWQGNHLVSERRIKAQMLSPPLASTEMFIYLHRKHAHLAEPAARALRAMKADGTYQRIVARTLPGFGVK